MDMYKKIHRLFNAFGIVFDKRIQLLRFFLFICQCFVKCLCTSSMLLHELVQQCFERFADGSLDSNLCKASFLPSRKFWLEGIHSASSTGHAHFIVFDKS